MMDDDDASRAATVAHARTRMQGPMTDDRWPMYEVRHAMRLFGVSEHCSTGKENRTVGATTTALEARIRLDTFE